VRPSAKAKGSSVVVVLALVIVALASGLLYVRHAVAGSVAAGDSMLPTFATGGDITISKLDKTPERGRVIVFRFPGKPGSDYVKRIVGLPGDTIATHGQEVVVNGAPLRRCDVGPWRFEAPGGGMHTGELWLEKLDGVEWLVVQDPDGIIKAAPGTWTVPPGEVFVLGDNRDNATDSRVWFDGKGGSLPMSAIVGSATGAVSPIVPPGAEALAPALSRCVAQLGK
jgi:signal peptidase I